MLLDSKTFLVLVLLYGNPLLRADENLPVDAGTDHLSRICQTFFAEHCLRCHGPDEAKSDLRLDLLCTDLSNSTTYDRWRAIVNRGQSGDMPPENKPQPEPAEVADIVKQVSPALNILPVHIERYLEAADEVLNAAIAPVHKGVETGRGRDSLPQQWRFCDRPEEVQCSGTGEISVSHGRFCASI